MPKNQKNWVSGHIDMSKLSVLKQHGTKDRIDLFLFQYFKNNIYNIRLIFFDHLCHILRCLLIQSITMMGL